jgi:hypothetical protein
VFPRRTSASPYSRPNDSSSGRKESKSRPSSRRFCFSASRMKTFSFVEGSSSFGIVAAVVVVVVRGKGGEEESPLARSHVVTTLPTSGPVTRTLLDTSDIV